jgi:hypothetical protein
MPPRYRFRSFCILLSLALVAGCKIGDDTADANKIIEDAKAGILAGNKLSEEAYTKFRSFMNPETIENFPSNREQIRPAAQESADLYAKSAATFRDQVVNKLEAASKLKINEKFKEYITLKAEAFRKLAESKEVAKELSLTPLAPSLTTQDALIAKAKEVDARLNALVQQYEETEQRANKVQQANPDIIKSSQ